MPSVDGRGSPAVSLADDRPMRIVTIGDVVIDVVALPVRPPAPDGDVPARVVLGSGGQAANVAAWSVWLGAPATVVGAVGDDPAGALARTLLEGRGVRLVGPVRATPSGVVVSVVEPGGRRSMLSDRGASASLSAGDLRAHWFAGASWLFVSGYCLFGPDGGDTASAAARLASPLGTRIAVDLSSAVLVTELGRAEVRRRIGLVGAELVFANEAELEAAGDTGAGTVVVKRGAAGHRVIAGGRVVEAPPPASTSAVDTTGAGDAFAAGWMVGGPPVARLAATTCIARAGATPPDGRAGEIAGRAQG